MTDLLTQNAEACAITGARAYARIDEDRSLFGWYGSKIADNHYFVVLDPSLPAGPICDAEIEKGLAAGTIKEVKPVRSSDIDSMDDQHLSALIMLGVVKFQKLLSLPAEENAIPAVGMTHFPDRFDPLSVVLDGKIFRTDMIDLKCLGARLAVLAHLRGSKLDSKNSRDEAVQKAVSFLRTMREHEISFESHINEMLTLGRR